MAAVLSCSRLPLASRLAGHSGSVLGGALLVASVWAAAGTSAFAQQPEASRAYRGLFPGAAGPAPSTSRVPTDTLDVRAGTFWVCERDGSRTGRTPVQADTVANSYAAVMAQASRTHTGKLYAYRLQGGTQFRRQQAPGTIAVDDQWLAASLRAQISERMVVTASQRLAYAPRYVLSARAASQLEAAAGSVAEPGRGIAPLPTFTATSGASVSRQFTRRTAALVAYGFDRVDFSSTGVIVSTHHALASVSRAMRRDLTWRLTYSSLWSTSGGSKASSAIHASDVGLGIDYSPTFSRRTAITFGLSPSVTRRSESLAGLAGASASDSHTSIVMGGFAGVERWLTSTWRADLKYERMVYYLPGNNQPILAGAVSGGVNGDLRQWMTATVSAAYSRGTPNIQRSQERVASLAVLARVEMRPSQTTSFYVEFHHDAYVMSEGIARLPGIGSNTSKTSFRVGFAMNVVPSNRRGR